MRFKPIKIKIPTTINDTTVTTINFFNSCPSSLRPEPDKTPQGGHSSTRKYRAESQRSAGIAPHGRPHLVDCAALIRPWPPRDRRWAVTVYPLRRKNISRVRPCWFLKGDNEMKGIRENNPMPPPKAVAQRPHGFSAPMCGSAHRCPVPACRARCAIRHRHCAGGRSLPHRVPA